jgi:DNA-directed RNA polymerase omega subunit
MKRDDGSLMYPPLEALVDRIPQKYELVLTATKRAKQLIIEMRHNPGLFNAEQSRTKPLTLALQEIAAGTIDKDQLLAAEIDFTDPDPEADFGTDFERYEAPHYERPVERVAEAVDLTVDFGDDDEEDEDDGSWEDGFTDDDDAEAAP